MAEIMSGNMNVELDLEKVARKFVMIPKEVTSKDKILAGGYLTEEEYSAVKLVPRSVEMESGTKWAKIKSGNKERTLYPFYGCLTEPEKAIYRDYKKGRSTGGSSLSSKVNENNKTLDSLKAELLALNVPMETISKLEQFRVTKKVGLIYEMFGYDTVSTIPGKVNLAYVMYRGPNDEFADTLQPDVVDLIVNKGFMPKFTLGQIKTNIKKLAERGINLENVIVDLK